MYCISYVLLIIMDQRQEFGVLRAIGARPRMILKIITWHIYTVIGLSLGHSLPLGIGVAILVLIPNPIVANYALLRAFS